MSAKAPRSIALVDFVLLYCQFSPVAVPPGETVKDAAHSDEDAQLDPSPSHRPGFVLDGTRFHVLSNETDEAENEYVFVLETTLEEPGLPYELSLVTGSRFTVPDPRVEPDDAAVTLLFIVFPYLRELIFAITSRSAFDGYRLAPLSKRPVWGEADTE